MTEAGPATGVVDRLERRSRGPAAGLVAALLAALALLAGCGVSAPAPAGAVLGSSTGVSPVSSAAPAAARAGCPAPSPDAPGAAESRLPVRSLCALPPEAGQVWTTISTGGRPAYSKDGSTFANFELRLPQRARGYYREYTVPTPDARDRGARRLVTGESREVYYTGDHYDSFVVVDPSAR